MQGKQILNIGKQLGVASGWNKGFDFAMNSILEVIDEKIGEYPESANALEALKQDVLYLSGQSDEMSNNRR